MVVCAKLNRLKTLDKDLLATPLDRCLSVLDMTLLGIGYMIGPGIYVVTGTVVQDEAGPGATLSYVVAGVAATLASLCYAEFGARIPLAGSAYTYTYVSMGEIWAFIVGWNMILEYIIAAASSAKAFSATLDATCNGAISIAMVEFFGLPKYSWQSPYPDFIAVLTVLLCMAFVATGAKFSVRFNNVLSALVIASIILIIGVGFSVADVDLWKSPVYGGFLPYGVAGVFQGAATCFYSYIGFDGIAVAGEEAINPKKALPWATCISMLTVTTLYVLATAVLTLMVPYTEIYADAPFPVAFAQLGIPWAKYAVSVGSLIGIATSIMGGMYFLPRIAYAMANDGLLFEIFGRVVKKTQTPVIGIVILGLFACVLALIINLNVLVLLMSIGTLISFSFVAASVIVVRYRIEDPELSIPSDDSSDTKTEMLKLQPSNPTINSSLKFDSSHELKKLVDKSSELENLEQLEMLNTVIIVPGFSCFGLGEKVLNSWVYRKLGQDTCVVSILVILVLDIICLMLLVVYGMDTIVDADWWSIIFVIVLSLGVIACVFVLYLMPHSTYPNAFCVPLVPLLPIISIYFNVTMILMLNADTWIRLAIWMSIGLLLYGFYGIRHSKENKSLTADKDTPSYGTLHVDSAPGTPEGTDAAKPSDTS